MELIESFLTNNPCYAANVNRADSRYVRFQTRGPQGLMLHSVGCAQPRAQAFVNGWNRESYDRACVHAFIDANTGAVYQTLPWNYRGWHCGGSGNDTHLGIELCESACVKYPESGGVNFEILDAAKARADCQRAYESAVELFARLCGTWGLDPLTAICSHKEGGRQGIASGHVDPEHYWTRLETGLTMDGFRAAVKARLEAIQQSEAPGPIYRVQVGAFRNRSYAEAFLAQVRSHYPNAYLTAKGGDQP